MDLDRYVDVAAAVIDLPVTPDWKPGVVRFLGLAAEMARLLETVALDDAELVMAPVYSPDAFAGGKDD